MDIVYKACLISAYVFMQPMQYFSKIIFYIRAFICYSILHLFIWNHTRGEDLIETSVLLEYKLKL